MRRKLKGSQSMIQETILSRYQEGTRVASLFRFRSLRLRRSTKICRGDSELLSSQGQHRPISQPNASIRLRLS